MLKRLVLLLCGIGIVAIVYWFNAWNSSVSDLGGQPPTACTVQTAKRDCAKLNCINHVWYCDNHGTPTCFREKCVCQYACM